VAAGTVPFMSHEAVQGTITTKMDIYAFGVTILCLVAGRRAEGNGAGRGLVIEMEDALDEMEDGEAGPAISFLDKKIPMPQPPDAEVESLLRIAAKCLHSRHKKRPEARELLDILKHLQASADAREDGEFESNSLSKPSSSPDRQQWVSTGKRGMDDTKLFPVSASTDEFTGIAARFKQSMPNASIVGIDRVENGSSHEAFQLQTVTLEKALGADWDESKMRQMLFHGTKELKAIDSIVNSADGHGFLPLLSGTSTGAAHGDGTYFARDAKYSDGYAAKLPSGRKQMLVVNVLVGLWAQGKAGLKMPPFLPGEKHRRYNSLVNNVDNPSIFVVQHSNQAYAAYVITYDHQK